MNQKKEMVQERRKKMCQTYERLIALYGEEVFEAAVYKFLEKNLLSIEEGLDEKIDR